MTQNKVALITGANKGIGKEIARQLGLREHTVLIAARDESRGKAAADDLIQLGVNALAIRLDVTDEGSIVLASSWVDTEFGKLDVLVNNAGIALDGGVLASQVDVDTLRKTYETNVFGAFAVAKHFLQLLKRSDAARIVNMSSGLGSLTNNTDPAWMFAGVKPLAYNSSKAALNMLTVILADELKETPIKVNAADPGFTTTDLNQHRGTRSVEQGAAIAVHLATLDADGPTGGYFSDDGVVPW